ncbi:hypothetical protein L6V77_13315 [Myxococcota bacterium]|nr:hypothetical protein [Myxococcota bacterium]
MKITILGGGVSTPRLCGLLTAALPGALDIVLHGRRVDRLELLARAATHRAPGARVSAEAGLERALAGADAVVLLVRVGGFAARLHDELFPQAFGLAGDEGLGAGGLANGWRTVPFVQALADMVRRRCPGAFVANLMAPLGMTTAVLVDAGLDVLGICELPAVTRAALGYGPGDGRYGGLNHLGWFWDLPDRPGVHPLKYQARVFGDGPIAGAPAPQPPRAAALAALDARVAARLAAEPGRIAPEEGERPTPWFEHALLPVLAARLGGPAHAGFGNVRNGGLIPELPAAQVVEVELTVSGRVVTPRVPGPLPTETLGLLQRVARADRLGLDAARTRSVDGLRRAMAALPYSLSEAALHALTAAAVAPPAAGLEAALPPLPGMPTHDPEAPVP